jgi:hypothetical protein
MKPPAYIQRIIEAYAAGLIPMDASGTGHITIAHDPGCPALAGRSCECEPDILIQQPAPSGAKLN